jgi:hypothetical protein
MYTAEPVGAVRSNLAAISAEKLLMFLPDRRLRDSQGRASGWCDRCLRLH